MNLRGVLGAVEAPYPPLRRPLPLTLAVKCASELWSNDFVAEPSPVARLAEAARAGSQDFLEKTQALGANIARWGQGLVVGLTPRNFSESSLKTDRDSKSGSGRSRTCHLGLWDMGEGKRPAEGGVGALTTSLRSRGGLSKGGDPSLTSQFCGLSPRTARASPRGAEEALGDEALKAGRGG